MAANKQTDEPISIPNYPAATFPPSSLTERLAIGAGVIGVAACLILWIAFHVPPLRPKVWVEANIVEYGLFSSLLIGSGYFFKRRRLRLLQLAPEDEISQRVGIDVETLRGKFRERGIHPCCMVDGRLLYDPADFGDADLLLRPVIAAHDENLLRPAAVGHAGSENLLRAAQDQEASHEATQLQAGRL